MRLKKTNTYGNPKPLERDGKVMTNSGLCEISGQQKKTNAYGRPKPVEINVTIMANSGAVR